MLVCGDCSALSVVLYAPVHVPSSPSARARMHKMVFCLSGRARVPEMRSSSEICRTASRGSLLG